MQLSIFVLLFFFSYHFNIGFTMIPLSNTLTKHDAFIELRYTIGNKYYQLSAPFDSQSVTDSHLLIKRTFTSISQDSFEIEYTIEPTNNHQEDSSLIKLHHFEVFFDTDFNNNTIMAEGFQCWSQTREMDKTTTLPKIQSTVAWITKFDLQGDYNFFKYSGKRGVIHSTGYTYIRNTQDDSILFLGSLSENNGYSYFKVDFNSHRFAIYKDIEGKTLPTNDKLTFTYFGTQHHDQSVLWQRYANQYLPTLDNKITMTKPPSISGWTSWYNFYEAVTEKDVLDSIDGFVEYGYPVDLIQVDDGYETAIGDWLDVDAVKFPNGMKFIADEIKHRTDNKAIPGIWLAPFAVGLKSSIIKNHPDWLVYQSDGTPLLAGPNWGGFRALDIYHPEVRDYLQRVFDTVIEDWGYKFLKLDFIFAAAMVPRQGKSRGEIMWDAVTLITELTKKRALLLGSGLSLPSVWGRMDYNRVSSDASPWWDHSLLRIANVRERVATYNALVSTLNRWPMNNVMFGNDPDVYFIRSNNNKLTTDERYTLVMINNLLGQMALMSDNVARYTKEEHDLYSKTFPKVVVKMDHMDRLGADVYRLHYTCNGRSYITVTNISPLPYRFLLPTLTTSQRSSSNNDNIDVIYFEYKNALLKGDKPSVQWIDAKLEIPLIIRSHETRTFMKVEDDFVGSTGHIIPGWEMESYIRQGVHQDLAHIKLRKPRIQHSDIYLYFKASGYMANGKQGDNVEMDSKIFIDDRKVNTIQLLTKNDDISIPFPILQVTYSKHS
ncbi:glycoside hydrolase superfamily [Halteromyces radiatus]|uniref:glycoside hydrolase superfamily n=1 Tax=Halteromyces radiatus TaxID=101107 RepID=UPI0022212311|nr:glycoside hydrolase superfamily [Halteromyces radiatus]KAI8086388.1 glycoside hydrolase superfamily [Halteromyces radiatus]